MEVVANDMTKLRIHRGIDGAVLWQVDHSNGTGWDYPTVADVDADGRLDIVVGLSFGAFGGRADPLFTGVRVYGDARWAPARPLWNQHAYARQQHPLRPDHPRDACARCGRSRPTRCCPRVTCRGCCARSWAARAARWT